MQQRTEIHVVGGGIAGLAAAGFVARAGHPVVVHETRNRLGGRSTTDEHDGFHFNQGPHALYNGGAGASVLRELGVRTRGAAPAVTGVTVRDGEVFEAPGGPASLLRTRLLGMREKLELARVLAAVRGADARDLADHTVAEWLEDHVRYERVREAVATLFRLGTYVNAPELLSAEVAVEQFQLALRRGVTYLDDGWQQLVDLLAARPGVRIEHGDPVRELPDAAAVIVAAGGPAVASRLLGREFVTGPPAEVSCLDIGMAGDPVHAFALGVDEPMYLSKHSIAHGHAPDGMSSVAVAEYLAEGVQPERERLDRFARTVGIPDDSIVTRRYLHRMVAVTAIPTAASGGLRGRPGVEVRDLPGVFLAGDWVGPVGHLADASLASAREAARAAVTHLERRPAVR